MLDNLTNRFYTVFRNIRGQARLDEENIKPALREVRLALLEADVALPVVKDFVADLKAKAVGQEISENLTAEQAFISIVNQAHIPPTDWPEKSGLYAHGRTPVNQSATWNAP